MKNSNLKAPSHLRPDTRAWWLSVHQDYDLAEHHSRLLTMACEAWDRAAQAREIMAVDGIVIGGREAAAALKSGYRRQRLLEAIEPANEHQVRWIDRRGEDAN